MCCLMPCSVDGVPLFLGRCVSWFFCGVGGMWRVSVVTSGWKSERYMRPSARMLPSCMRSGCILLFTGCRYFVLKR